jgi:hypothetical protein
MNHSLMKGVVASILLLWPAALAADTNSVRTNDLASWHGIWRGRLEIWDSAKPVQSVPMELHIAPGTTRGELAWKIIYGEGEKRQERPYKLVTRDAARGQYAVDEGNGIVLPLRRFGERLFSEFTVQGNRLLARYELQPDGTLVYEIITGREAATEKTGGKDRVPEVSAVPVSSFQRAVLKREPQPADATAAGAAQPGSGSK